VFLSGISYSLSKNFTGIYMGLVLQFSFLSPELVKEKKNPLKVFKFGYLIQDYSTFLNKNKKQQAKRR
jgi:hypothetical protein